ncbi:MAG: hypothetical protein VX219_03250 [Actinomycetota bacterium]|nr:hypothetical protein [Actinomycetota bacterium]
MVGAAVVAVAVVVVGAAVVAVVATGASVVSTVDGAFVPIELADGLATSSSGTAAPPPQAVPARSTASHTFMRTKPLFPNPGNFQKNCGADGATTPTYLTPDDYGPRQDSRRNLCG